jgi:phosphatidylglycerol:prolipoprotein diacylglycerol transferase
MGGREMALDPIAFQLGALQVHWYGIILGSAAIAGLYLAIWEGKRFGIDKDVFLDLLLWGAPAAILGARLYYVLFKLDYYLANPADIFAIWKGGLAIHGALIGAIITGIIFARIKRIPFWKLADIAAPSLLIGQAIGRWGNFMNQEAHGGPVSEAFLRETLKLPDFIVNQMFINGTYYHPTFLYESIWNITGVLFLFWLRRQNLKLGEVFFSYFIWYSIGRFFIEGLRTDSLAFTTADWVAGLMEWFWLPMNLLFDPGNMSYGNVRIAQFISVVSILAAIILIIVRRMKGWANTRYNDKI